MSQVTDRPATDAPYTPLPVAAPRHIGRWIAVVVLVALAGLVVYSLVTNPRFGWPIVFEWFLSPRILNGLLATLELTAISMIIGVVLGGVLGVMRLSSNRIISGAAGLYIWFFRGTPVFVQLLFWGSISALYPVIQVGIPFGPIFGEFSANEVVTPFLAAILGLGLNEAAYMAEIVRSGIRSVDDGQREAAAALGMGRARVFRRIVLPQALRTAVPALSNSLIGMIKDTSLASNITVAELFMAGQRVAARTYIFLPIYCEVAVVYLLFCTVITKLQGLLERQLNAHGFQ